MKRVLSMGAGVQTTAILIDSQDYDLVMFADTGAEHVETYDYIDKYLIPFCKKRGLVWKTVRNEKWTLEDSLRHYNGPPDTYHRVCTNDFKVRPIQRYMRRVHKVTATNPYTLIMGITYDEAHRANMSPRYLYELRAFPLVDKKMTRQDCKDVIRRHGWPLPRKSGCDFCPLQRRAGWKRLKVESPKRFAELVELERDFKNGMTFSLSGVPLTKYLESHQLEDFGECIDGSCHV